MDDTEDDSRYEYGSSNRKKIPFRDNSYSRPVASQYSDEEDEEEEEEGEEEEEQEQEEQEENEEFGDEEDEHNNKNGLSNGYPIVRKDTIDLDGESESDEESDDDGENRSDGPDSTRHPRKRKLKSLISSYEFAPRVPPAGPIKPPPPRNSLTDWTEQETVALLDSWGDRYLRRGRKSLRSEEWHEVAEKVSEVSESDRTETQCRNRLDTLKKKYKKEKLGPSNSSKWAYFKKMDLLLSTTPSVPPRQRQKNPKLDPRNPGLSCGLDSGEYVFMNPRVYLNRANGLDEMRDSPGNSESDDDDDGEGSDGLPPKKRKKYVDEEGSCSSSSSFRLIANSIRKFSEVYEKIEASKRQQMVEIEKMRMDFQRDLEAQKRQIMERAQSEIAKIRRGDDDDDDDDEAENGSG